MSTTCSCAPKFSLPLPLLTPFNATLASLWARNYATILQVLILKFAFGPGKFPGLLKKRPLISYMGHLILRIKLTFEVFCAGAWNFAPFPKNLILLFISGVFLRKFLHWQRSFHHYSIITAIKVNFGSMHTVSRVRFQIWGLCLCVLIGAGGLI